NLVCSLTAGLGLFVFKRGSFSPLCPCSAGFFLSFFAFFLMASIVCFRAAVGVFCRNGWYFRERFWSFSVLSGDMVETVQTQLTLARSKDYCCRQLKDWLLLPVMTLV